MNNLNFSSPDLSKFPLLKILKLLPNKISLFETILITANDETVKLFLDKKIKYTDINKKIYKVISLKEFKKYKKITPKNISLRTAVEQNDEQKMHKLLWSAGNCNLYNIELFTKNNWEDYIKAVNESNGQFKYRWGDIEVIGLFIYTFFENPLYDFDLIKKKLYLNKFYKSKYYLLSIMAPSPEDKLNVNFIIFKIFYMLFKFLKIFKIKR